MRRCALHWFVCLLCSLRRCQWCEKRFDSAVITISKSNGQNREWKGQQGWKEVFDETALNFNAETHAEHIRNIFRYYNLDVEEWAVCQTADNCSVNLKVADLLGIPHVACKNHLLNLEVNEMVKQNRDLEITLNSIHETMSSCKKKLKNAALLRNLVSLVPVLHNKTRWSGKLYMMERFLRISNSC